jgi:hypothetical protein
MIRKSWIISIILFAVVGFSSIACAGLTLIGTASYNGNNYNLIYEDDQGLIWLDYSNRLCAGWDDCVKWAAGLNTGGSVTCKFNPGVAVSWSGDWRLPKTMDGERHYGYDGSTTAGYNITSSEMGHLFYKSLGDSGWYDAKGKKLAGWGGDAVWGLKKKGPFSHLYPDFYWSGTEYSIYDQRAWAFNFNFGSQSNGAFKSIGNYAALAVRPGKVTTTTVR